MKGLLFGSIVYLGIICLTVGCSRLAEAENEKVRRRNATAEAIYRNAEDRFYVLGTPAHSPRAIYPWEAEAHLPRITREYFRCKGNPANPPELHADSGAAEPLFDCEGKSRHGLPILSGREGVYPILIDLLNYIQKKTGKRVVVTCGHRCPVHNAYSDPSKENRTSKHQIGAEVDFYVHGMEDYPLEIAGLLMQYYQETPLYKNNKEYLEFKRSEAGSTATQPFMNKEILIKVYQKDEGRDADNRHPHPYISLQVRFDKEKRERVIYEWAKANQGYPRG
jgi:hypothetical protein